MSPEVAGGADFKLPSQALLLIWPREARPVLLINLALAKSVVSYSGKLVDLPVVLMCRSPRY
jgi:hypothetical protein